jgi:hypothetical protein
MVIASLRKLANHTGLRRDYKTIIAARSIKCDIVIKPRYRGLTGAVAHIEVIEAKQTYC